MDVPEIPLSYSPTGAKKMLTPKALMQPATNRKIKFCHRRDLESSWISCFVLTILLLLRDLIQHFVNRIP